MRYTITGAAEHLMRSKHHAGFNLTNPHRAIVKFGQITSVKTGAKIKLNDGYFGLLSVTPAFATAGLTIINNVVHPCRERTLDILVTCASTDGVRIDRYEYFCNLIIVEEGWRSPALYLSAEKWESPDNARTDVNAVTDDDDNNDDDEIKEVKKPKLTAQSVDLDENLVVTIVDGNGDDDDDDQRGLFTCSQAL
jgi:dUTPase